MLNCWLISCHQNMWSYPLWICKKSILCCPEQLCKPPRAKHVCKYVYYHFSLRNHQTSRSALQKLLELFSSLFQDSLHSFVCLLQILFLELLEVWAVCSKHLPSQGNWKIWKKEDCGRGSEILQWILSHLWFFTSSAPSLMQPSLLVLSCTSNLSMRSLAVASINLGHFIFPARIFS